MRHRASETTTHGHGLLLLNMGRTGVEGQAGRGCPLFRPPLDRPSIDLPGIDEPKAPTQNEFLRSKNRYAARWATFIKSQMGVCKTAEIPSNNPSLPPGSTPTPFNLDTLGMWPNLVRPKSRFGQSPPELVDVGPTIVKFGPIGHNRAESGQDWPTLG